MAIIGNNVIGSFADDSQAVDLKQVSKCNSGPGGKVVKAVGHVSGVSFGSGNQQHRWCRIRMGGLPVHEQRVCSV
jgi:hypothetical protein